MKLKEYRENYYSSSSKTGEVARQLAFAGIAMIWVFTNHLPNSTRIPNDLLWPGIFFVASLAFDLLHCVVHTITWGIAGWRLEQSDKRDQDVMHSPKLNWPILFFFWGKIVLLVMAYWDLFWYMYANLI